jgi:DNA (cytosine-5)-methyltransferase 1
MRYGSVCSGIEAATAAWHHMGWEAAFFSEIEAFPSAVLTHHYPDVPLHGDFTTIEKNQYGKIDLLVGGTPCQSFSVAGLRGGLDDDRGNLALEFCRLAQREQPRWIVWENVPGVLSSSGGRDFGSILGALEDLGYGLAYRVLDAQYFGVAQRRRRVFVVGYLGDWRPAAAVLFERHSMSGHPAPSRQARQEAAGAAATGAGGSGGNGGARPDLDTFECGGIGSYAASDNSSPLLRTGADLGPGCEALIASTGPDTVGTLRTRRPGEGGVQGDFDHIVPVISPALNTQSGSHHAPDTKAYVATLDAAHAFKVRGGCEGGGKGYLGSDEVAFTISTHQDQHIFSEPAIAWSEELTASVDLAGTIQRGGSGGRHDGVMVPHSEKQKPLDPYLGGEVTIAIDASYAKGCGGTSAAERPVVAANSTVRRLTPVECERLQGFPDNFTAIPWRKKGAEDCPDGPRYKALGNSMAVPVMRWIGERINLIDNLVSVL